MCHLSELLVKGGKYQPYTKAENSTTKIKIQNKMYHSISLLPLLFLTHKSVVYLYRVHYV
jgi:hypothetical protein